MPRAVSTRIRSMIAPPIMFAHRGARARAPENTLEAFKLAQQMGATGIETDAWRTADGEVVLVHDGSLPRLPPLPGIGKLGRPISSLRRERLPATVPTLDEYYEHCGVDLPVSIDIKHERAFEDVMTVARAHGASEMLWACHHDLATLARWRDAFPDVKLVHSTRSERLKRGAERHAAELARAGVNAVNLRRDDWSGGLVTLYHRFGLYAFGWDAQETRHIAELVDSGIDAVYSDHVDRMTAVISEFFTH